MKINKLIFPLMIALAAMLATTGCKRGFNGKPTPLPGANQTGINDQNNQNTLPPGNPIAPETGPMNTTPGNLATSTTWDPADTIQDRATLAAYTVHFAYDSA